MTRQHIDLDVSGLTLHIIEGYGEVEIWLDPSTQNYEGVCIGGGVSREDAITDTIAGLEDAVRALKGLQQ
jgi:hypothetical protein